MKDRSSTQLKKEIYLRNVARRWKSELKNQKKVYVLSPYITSKTAENTVIDAKECEIYTVLNIENFLIGASSVKCLKNLLDKGCKVYAVSKLHAKIILVPDTFVSIGSQNLTNQGTQNKEATFTSTSLKIVKFVETEIKEWLKDAEEISIEMIEDLEKQLRPLKKNYKKIKKEVKKAEEFVKEQEKERKAKILEEIERKKRLEKLRANIQEIRKTQEIIKGSVIKKEYYSYQFWEYLKLMTFVPDTKNPDLLNWRIGLNKFSLHKTYRYLALIEDTGKLGWVRVVKTRISKYAEGVSHSQPINLNGNNYDLWLRANWNLTNYPDYNLTINLDTGKCKIYVWFDLTGLEIIKIEHNGYENLESWINDNEASFKNTIIENILKSFKYNKNLQGVEADKFLAVGKKYNLRMGEINNNKFLLFSET